MAVTPNSVVTPQKVLTYNAVCTTAKTNYFDTTNAVKLIEGDDIPNGALIKSLRAIARATTSADIQLQFYRSRDGGVTLILSKSVVLPAYTYSTTTAPTAADFGATPDAPIRLGPGEEIWVAIATGLASGVVFEAEVEAY